MWGKIRGTVLSWNGFKMVSVSACNSSIFALWHNVLQNEPKAHKKNYGVWRIQAVLAFLWLKGIYHYGLYDERGYRIESRRSIPWHFHLILLLWARLCTCIGRSYIYQKLYQLWKNERKRVLIMTNEKYKPRFIVHLETYIPWIDSTCCRWSNDLDLCDHQNGNLYSPTKQLVFRRR